MSKQRPTATDERHWLVRSMEAQFTDGSALASHSHSWGQLIWADRGVLSVWTEQGSWVAPPAWAVWAPRDVAHGLRFSGRVRLRTLYLRPSLAGQPAASTVVCVSALLRELIVRTVELGRLDRRVPEHAAMVQLILGELVPQHALPLDLPWPRSVDLCRIAERISSATGPIASLAQLAREAGLGLRSLERRFTRETGLSLGRWSRHARLQASLRRLGAGDSVKAVARASGYASPSSFVAAFRAMFHTTPGRHFSSARDRRESPPH